MAKTSEMAQRRALARATDDPNYRRRREELLRAAAKVFKAKGYAGASLNDIAAEVGIDRASLYYYASGKEELYQEIVFNAVHDNVTAIERIQQERATAIDKVGKFVRTLMQSYETHYPYLYIYVQENMASLDDTAWTRRVRQLARRFTRAATAIVQQGIDAGEFRPEVGDAKLVAFGIIGMCNWTHRWFQPGREANADEIGGVFSELILGGLKR
jgi:AcrR family transcriptional regulator